MVAEHEGIQDLTERFLDHAYATDYADFADTVLQRAHHRILDGLGNILVGHRASGTQELIDMIAGWGGREDATILGDGRKVPAHHAAMANAILIRSFDFEPVGAEGPGKRQIAAHITGTTLPVALAIGEREGSTGREILTALLVGEDIAARLAFGSGFDVYSGQDNTGTVNGIGATITAALLMKLTRQQTRHALGIVTNQLAGTVEAIFDQTSTFKLPMAFAARNAIMAAEMAAAGVTGPADPLQGKFGFVPIYCANPNTQVMVEALGEEYYADSVIKPWSCCRAAQPSLDATLQLRQALQLDAAALDDISSVRVHVTPRTAAGFVGKPFSVGECPEVSAAFSIHYTTAAALVHGTVRPEHMSLQATQDPRVSKLLERIEIVGSLDPGEVLTARVEMTTSDGTQAQRVDTPLGDVYHQPLTEEHIHQKFLANVDYSQRLSAASAQQVVQTVPVLHDHENLTELLNLLSNR